MSDATSADVGTGPAAPIISVSPVTLAAPNRAEHGLGGIQGYNDTRTTDESPERVAVIQQATLAYLRTALSLDDGAWPTAREALAATSGPLGRIDSK